MDASMSLGRSVGPLEDQGLSGMKGAEIGGSACLFAEFNGEDGSSVGERLARLVEVPVGLGLHRSMPSRRISCISGVRSR
jgi:hypothetical protein